MTAIDVTDLYFAYQETPVLEEITFSIEPGAFVGVIGPNGGGKTTLLNLLMGFLTPTRGKIRLFGKVPKQITQKIGWVPQHFHYDRTFPISVLEVVLAGTLSQGKSFGGYGKEAKKNALDALEKVGMRHTSQSAFSELSGGQAQRILLARSLVSNPTILFLDEPTANVDVTAQKEIYKTLASLKGKITILMVTHDLRAAASNVDRVLCIERKLTLMSPKEVCEHFALGLYHPLLEIK